MSAAARRASAEVAERNGERSQLEKAIEDVEQRVEDARKWFAQVVPAGFDADQFVALALGYCKRDPGLLQAAFLNPDSLMLALAEPARLGLVLGEEYHLTHFANQKTGVPDVTGMRDYKGEIQLILRSGQVAGVHLYVVRRRGPRRQGAPKPDRFRFGPGMPMPEHVIADDGLATDEERGDLFAAWGFCSLRGGGITAPIVMTRDEIAKHRAAAKTLKWWGPDWPEEGPWTPNMWRKTVAHALYDVVPHSAAHQADMLRASVAWDTVTPQMLRLPAGEIPPQPSEYAAIEAQPAAAQTAQPAGQSTAKRAAQQAQSPEAANAQRERRRHMTAIRDVLRAADLGSSDAADQRLALASVFACEDGQQPLALDRIESLSDEQVARARKRLDEFVAACERDGLPISLKLRELAQSVIAQAPQS